MDHHLHFGTHLRSIAINVGQRIGFLRKAAMVLDSPGRLAAYNGFILPTLEYSPLEWEAAVASHLSASIGLETCPIIGRSRFDRGQPQWSPLPLQANMQSQRPRTPAADPVPTSPTSLSQDHPSAPIRTHLSTIKPTPVHSPCIPATQLSIISLHSFRFGTPFARSPAVVSSPQRSAKLQANSVQYLP